MEELDPSRGLFRIIVTCKCCISDLDSFSGCIYEAPDFVFADYAAIANLGYTGWNREMMRCYLGYTEF
jgi:hypothetical protein